MAKVKKQKIDQNVIIVAFDSAMDTFTQASSTDQLLAETGKTRQQLLDTIKRDDEVEGCREDLRTAILAEPWRLYAFDDTVPETTINVLYTLVRKFSKEFVELAIDAKFGGYMVAEYVFKKQANGFLTLDKILSKDGELDKYVPQRDGEVIYKGEMDETLIDQTIKYLVLKSKATPANPAGELMVIRIYPAVALRNRDWAYAGQFIARYAVPYIVGKQGGYTDQKVFTNSLFGFLNGGATGIGKDDDIQMHQLSGDGSAFEIFERMANRRIQKLLLGRVKTSELTSGSRSAQETDDQVREDRVSAYLDLMTEGIQHAINAIIAVNAMWGVPINAPQGIWFEYLSKNPPNKTLAEVVKIYQDGGTVRMTKAFYTDVVGWDEKHFEMVEQPQQGQQLSQSPQPTTLPQPTAPTGQPDGHIDMGNQQFVLARQPTPDPTPSATETKIGKAKLNAILSILSDIDDDDEHGYAKFSQKLDDLTLPDGGFTEDLADKTTDSYLKGLDGYVNENGENQL